VSRSGAVGPSSHAGPGAAHGRVTDPLPIGGSPELASPGALSAAWTPLAARRLHLELYIRWVQEVRWFKPSTVSRRFSVAAGLYRTCVIEGLLEHSPAEHVRRPAVPAESPTLGFTHLQFEAPLTAARDSANPYDFALLPCWGCSACGSSKPLVQTSPTSAKSTGTGTARVRQRHQDRLDPAATSRRAGYRPGDRHPQRRPDPAQQPYRRDKPPRRHPPVAAPGRYRWGADHQATPAHAPPYLRHHHARRRS
jgi:hypothetical protein